MKKITGTVTGIAATINVEVGFKPTKVVVRNVTTLNANEFNEADETNAYGRIITASTGVITAAGSAAAGIVQYDGSEGAESEGFTIGASALVNVSTNVLEWEAELAD